MSRSYHVFLSYHHENDEEYKIRFEAKGGNIYVSNPVEIRDIDPNLACETIPKKIRDEYLRDSTVTVVLVGKETWNQKQVDWEIASSIQPTQDHPRSGLLGLVLPTHPNYSSKAVEPHLIPPRLYDNIKSRYAKIYRWTENPSTIQSWIHAAFRRKERRKSDNSRPLSINA